jgi:hypothetical protein
MLGLECPTPTRKLTAPKDKKNSEKFDFSLPAFYLSTSFHLRAFLRFLFDLALCLRGGSEKHTGTGASGHGDFRFCVRISLATFSGRSGTRQVRSHPLSVRIGWYAPRPDSSDLRSRRKRIYDRSFCGPKARPLRLEGRSEKFPGPSSRLRSGAIRNH